MGISGGIGHQGSQSTFNGAKLSEILGAIVDDNANIGWVVWLTGTVDEAGNLVLESKPVSLTVITGQRTVLRTRTTMYSL